MPLIYKQLNLIALGGTLVYGYLLGRIEDDLIADVSNSAFTNPNGDDGVRRLRATSSSTSSHKFENGAVINHRGGKASTINLIGERHSGTKWITNHLIDCFGERFR